MDTLLPASLFSLYTIRCSIPAKSYIDHRGRDLSLKRATNLDHLCPMNRTNGWGTRQNTPAKADPETDASEENLNMKNAALAITLAAGGLMMAAPAFAANEGNEGRGQ